MTKLENIDMASNKLAAAAALRASTLAERIAARYRFGNGADADRIAEERWRLLCTHVAKGDAAIAARVLEWRGIEADHYRAALRPVDTGTSPAWLATFEHMEAATAANIGQPGCLCADDPRPNEKLFACVVEAAAREPRCRLHDLGAAPHALAPLERDLLVSLTAMSAGALGETGARDLHDILTATPVLARLIATRWANWIDAVGEMLARLAADQAVLCAFLGVARLAPLAEISAEGGDRHDGGRVVMTLAFTDGCRVVYKPRDMALDAGFADFIAALRRSGLDLAEIVPRTLVRTGYGWAEFIVARRAADADQLKRFWGRVGLLLGVLTAIGGSDIHYGNVIAAGDRLVVIDLETMLRPEFTDTEPPVHGADTAIGRLQSLLEGSAVMTCMLPTKLHLGRGRYSEIGALSAHNGVDDVHRASDRPPAQQLVEHLPLLLERFRHALAHLREHRDALTVAGGPLDRMAAGTARVVFRPTNLYARLLRLGWQPGMLRDGADRDVLLEQLARMLAPFATPPPYVTLVDAEKRALAEGDIPRFHVALDGYNLCDRFGVVAPGAFRASAIGGARRRLSLLSAPAEALHARIVGLAMQSHAIGADVAMAEEADDAGAFGDASPLSAARAIGRILADLAIEGEDGEVVWLCPDRDTEDGRFGFAGHNPNLGEGCLGIAVFLAALARATGDAAATALAARALPALKPASSSYRSLVPPRLGIARGLGGRIWGLTAAARLGGVAWCLEAAATSLGEALDAPPSSDWTVGGGVAGLLLGGLALRAAAPALVAESALAAVADHLNALLGHRDAGSASGLLDGATGAGHALLRAAAILDRPHYRDAAATALTRSGSDDTGTGWACGAAGRFLARQAADRLMPGRARLPDLMAADLTAVSRATTASGPSTSDGMWSGHAGQLPVPGLPDVTRLLCDRAAGCRLRPVSPTVPGVVMPGLFNGIAGIGYALLRHADGSMPDLHLFC